VIGTLQAFSWEPVASGGRYPSSSESRNLLYGALINGVRGVLWYSYYFQAGSTMPEEAPELWEELQLQVLELEVLREHLIDGTRTLLDTGNERVHGARWNYDGETVVALLNVDRVESYSVDIVVPGADGFAAHPFAHRPVPTYSVSGATLSATLGPVEVGVYTLATATNVTTSSTTTTTLAGGCAPIPRGSCRGSQKAAFQIKDRSEGTKDQLKWKLSRGDAFTQADLGDPANTTTYTLCIYDETVDVPALVGSLRIAPMGSWEDTAPKGWKYRDSTGAVRWHEVLQPERGRNGSVGQQRHLDLLDESVPGVGPEERAGGFQGQGSLAPIDPGLLRSHRHRLPC